MPSRIDEIVSAITRLERELEQEMHGAREQWRYRVDAGRVRFQADVREAHRRLNRHHLTMADGVPADVNLIDVLDFIADCVMAGMARSGSVYPLHLSPELLEAAFQNTVALLKAQVTVKP